MKKLCFILCLLTAGIPFLCQCTSSENEDIAQLDTVRESVQYVQNNFISPEDYIIEKFENHDVVILGEMHRIKHDPELVQKVIPLLHKNGIYTVAIEFALYEDQPLIDTLITAPEYDEALAREINLKALLSIGLGGYQEYCDIFKAAWKVNAALPKGAKKMRILGLNDTLDWSILKTQEDKNNYELRRQIFKSASEKHWADRIKTEVLEKGEKALCYCGMHHAFSKYKQPIADNGKFIRFVEDRFGNYLYAEIKNKVVTIALHHPCVSAKGYEATPVLPVDGKIDILLASLPEDKQYFGFDTSNTPMGTFTSTTSFYKFGYDNFCLRNFCDGYICQGTFSQYEGVTYIKNFVNEANIERVRKFFPNPHFRNASAKEFNNAIASEANIRRHHLKSALKETKKLKRCL